MRKAAQRLPDPNYGHAVELGADSILGLRGSLAGMRPEVELARVGRADKAVGYAS
jgi:hypothetical protein